MLHIRDQDNGLIQAQIGGIPTKVSYHLRDCKPRETPRYQDKVEFVLVTKKSNGHHFARDVSILEKAVFQQGYVCALKETFGFIEVSSHDHEYFFHFSAVSDGTILELGDFVQFIETKSGEKVSADNITKIALNRVAEDEIMPAVYEGIVIRPMRTVDPDVSVFNIKYESLASTNATIT